MTSQGCRFAGNAFLHVTIAGDHKDVVVECALTSWGLWVEQAALEARCIGKTGCRCQALAEWASGDFNTLGVGVFWVTRGLRTPGAKRLQVV